ncbi:MAG: LD-carboxypeptidase [Spirosomataceae bacterium]
MKQPNFLKPGDTVGIVALAGKVNPSAVEPAVAILQSWGLTVEIGTSVASGYFQFAGTDEVRRHDFQQFLDNPNVRAIFSARGGYGSSRILDDLDFSGFLQHPQWLVGFSDITAVHAHVHNLGVMSIHGPMPKSFTQEGGELALETLQKALFGEPLRVEVAPHPLNRLGTATAPMIGGNLCLLAHLIGSKSDVSTDGKILFLEDVGEKVYNLDRMMLQLRRAGKLSNLAGLLVGQFTDLADYDTPFGKTAWEIVAEHTAAYSYPVCYDFPVGHVPDNRAIVCGATAQLHVGSEDVTWLTSF